MRLLPRDSRLSCWILCVSIQKCSLYTPLLRRGCLPFFALQKWQIPHEENSTATEVRTHTWRHIHTSDSFILKSGFGGVLEQPILPHLLEGSVQRCRTVDADAVLNRLHP